MVMEPHHIYVCLRAALMLGARAQPGQHHLVVPAAGLPKAVSTQCWVFS